MKLKLVLNTEESTFYMSLFWNNPLVKALITMKDKKPVISLFLMNKKIFGKIIRKRANKRNSKNLMQIVKPESIHLDIDYGFSDPFTTGIACGALNIASQFLNIDQLNQRPNFVAEKDYIYLNATAKINLREAIAKYCKLKK